MPNFISKIMGNSVSLEEELINLRMTSKQMQRASKKCDKNEKAAVVKVKKVRLLRRGVSTVVSRRVVSCRRVAESFPPVYLSLSLSLSLALSRARALVDT